MPHETTWAEGPFRPEHLTEIAEGTPRAEREAQVNKAADEAKRRILSMGFTLFHDEPSHPGSFFVDRHMTFQKKGVDGNYYATVTHWNHMNGIEYKWETPGDWTKTQGSSRNLSDLLSAFKNG